jgi:Zn-finger nucleic acid-binding protein
MTTDVWQVSCPKCGAAMGAVDKSGVRIERCPACRGIFLDQGELDRVIEAETSFYAQPPQHREHRRRNAYPDSRYDRYSGHQRRRRSFFEELFD